MADQPASGKNTSRFENFGKKVDEQFNQAIPQVEEELKKLIAHLNDEVVPQIRRNSSQALRAAAERLRKLAEQLDNGPGTGAR
jgi:division protein CdvB (Snf7/Vps24/ESCRT-III family)